MSARSPPEPTYEAQNKISAYSCMKINDSGGDNTAGAGVKTIRAEAPGRVGRG